MIAGNLLFLRLDLFFDWSGTAFPETFSFFLSFYFGCFFLQFHLFKAELNYPEFLAISLAISTLDLFAFQVAFYFIEKMIILFDLIESNLVVGAI